MQEVKGHVLKRRWAESAMSMTTVSADASQCMYEFLHSELVSYLHEKAPGSNKVRDEFRAGDE